MTTCTYCHGARLVGWSGAGPILCPECSRGQDAFAVITQAWREQRIKAQALAERLAIMEREPVDLIQGVDDGVAHRMDRVAATGNGQVPRVARLAWETLR